ncbi:MAG TPA: DEAD/DEAH box helicase, partial [Nitrososphaerales archaeon]|nr:DEAD/DEAH box helicase [Nitrososphaerales archaeon]
MLISEIPNLQTEFVDALHKKGYESLYPPQADAVAAGVLEGKNLVLATPTASGKTLVAMMAAIRAIERGGKVVYLAPLRALASEKYEEFKGIFETLKRPGTRSKLRVFISTGDYDSSGESLGGGDVIILTNERFDSVARHNVSWIDSVSLFIADEVHLVGDSHRGPTLEMILAKVMKFVPSAQILALSATISNTKDLAEWLKAELVETNWRPVKLVEGIYDYGTLSFVEGGQRKLIQSNRGAAIDVAIDAVKEGGQSLIFCDTRKKSVAAAEKAAEILSNFLSFEDSGRLREIAHKITSAGEETEVSRRLAEIVAKGAAFHHAGLDSKHRKIVEDAYREREIKILTATPTLAAGVNLPARRVVLASLFRYNLEEGGQTPISVLEFKQMAGRAGRPRYDKVGEIVLLAGNQMNAQEIYEHYIEGKAEPIRSQL